MSEPIPAIPAREAKRTYHHGTLRDALVEVAENILAEKGVEGLTLRECARRAGVSPAAPAHHFGDVAGLLTAVAIRGFEALNAALEAGNQRGGDSPAERLRQQGVGYVSFALASPGAFKLIFRRDKLNCDDPTLKMAARGAFLQLEKALRALKGTPDGALDMPTFGAVIAAWSLVHGFAHLAVDGELAKMFDQNSEPDAIISILLPTVLSHLPDSGDRD